MPSKNTLQTLLYTAISLGIVAALIYTVNYAELIATLKTGNLLLIAGATLLITTLLPIVFSLRWQQTLHVLGHQISLPLLIRLQLAAFPISKFSPSNVGDLMKAYYLRQSVPYQPHMGAIAFERMIDLIILFLFAILGGLLTGNHAALLLGAGALAGVLTIFFGVRYISGRTANRPLIKKIRSFLVVFAQFTDHPGRALSIISYSLTAWLGIFTYIYVLFLAFGAPLSFLDVIALQPIAITIGLLPFTLAGIGTREAAMLVLYAPLIAQPATLATGLVYSVFSSVVLSLVGIPFLRYAFSNHRPHRVKEIS